MRSPARAGRSPRFAPREAADQQEEAEHRAAELTRWHTTDQTATEAAEELEHVNDVLDYAPEPAGAP